MPADAINPLRGIVLKLASVVVFVAMQTCMKSAGPDVPAGQIAFFRSAFGMAPILLYLAYIHELRGAFRTESKLGHFKRGILGVISMVFGFYGLSHLPLPDAIAIGYSTPLLGVIFAALFLKEAVGIYRWSAVFVGMIGVVIISLPKLTLFDQGGMESSQAMGAAALLVSAVLGAIAMLQTRQLVRTDKTATIVLYFSLSGAVLSLIFTAPFGWAFLSWSQCLLLIGSGLFGGIGQILLTEAYRNADVSTIAPFDYTSILLGIVIAYLLFGDVPTLLMLTGTAITVSAGIFIIFREHRLGLERKAARKASTPGPGV